VKSLSGVKYLQKKIWGILAIKQLWWWWQYSRLFAVMETLDFMTSLVIKFEVIWTLRMSVKSLVQKTL
jgi:hypothetical protein